MLVIISMVGLVVMGDCILIKDFHIPIKGVWIREIVVEFSNCTLSNIDGDRGDGFVMRRGEKRNLLLVFPIREFLS